MNETDNIKVPMLYVTLAEEFTPHMYDSVGVTHPKVKKFILKFTEVVWKPFQNRKIRVIQVYGEHKNWHCQSEKIYKVIDSEFLSVVGVDMTDQQDTITLCEHMVKEVSSE